MYSMDWKEKYKADIKLKLKESDEQYKLYKATKKVKHLNKAGNALIIAVKKHLMVKYNKRLKDYYGCYDCPKLTHDFIKKLKLTNKDMFFLVSANDSRIRMIYYGDVEPEFVVNMNYKDTREDMRKIMKKKEQRALTMEEIKQENKEFFEKLSKV